MNTSITLVKIFFSQMIRSKALWLMTAVIISMILLNLYYQSQFSEWIDGGMTYDMATQKASNKLNAIAEELRYYSVLFVIIVSALIAPVSRKNGTTQFVLSMQVSRLRLALSQYIALSLFITAAVLITHIGFSIAGLRLGNMGLPELLIGWLSLLIPLLIIAAVSFSISTAFSSIAVYIVLLGVPFLILPLLESLIRWKGEWVPVPMARLIDNLNFLFPNPDFLMFWPYLSSRLMTTDPPYSIWIWSVMNFILSAVFWIALSYYVYRGYNIGSRQVLK